MTARVPVLAAMACVAVLAVSGCGDSATSDSGDGLSVAASTGAWASVARAIGGESVHVSAVIDDPVADPHSYESTAEDVLTFTRADLAVVNGGGYDSFAEGLADQAPDVPVIDAFALSGHEAPEHEEAGHEEAGHEEAGHEHDHAHEHGGVNEHVWYDLHVVEQVADELVERLSKLAPEQAAEFEANGKKFADGLAKLRAELAAVKKQAGGAEVVSTEPVAFYLLEAAGLRDVTPKAFSNAIEGDSDVPVAAQAEVTRRVESGTVAAVVNNPQTETAVTRELVSVDERAGTPVVEIGEMPPDGESDYLRWVEAEIAKLKAAVAKS